VSSARRTREVLIEKPAPDGWVTVEKTGGFRIYKFWEDPRTGASICLLDVPKGASIPIRHRHASNQFMYCIKGRYEYVGPGLLLKPGSFYMNPKGHPHGPTVARTRCLLLEIYDGPHYFKTPSFHSEETVGRIAGTGTRSRQGAKSTPKSVAKGTKSTRKAVAKGAKSTSKRVAKGAKRPARKGG